MSLVLVAAGGALGSLARYLLAGAVHRVLPPFFPYGTFVVNVAGCLAFGFCVGLAYERFVLAESGRVFLLIGVLGGVTTFSTFTFETFELLRDGQLALAAVNSRGQLVVGLAALWGGWSLQRLV